jgi:DNA-binding NtrC family response regulator
VRYIAASNMSLRRLRDGFGGLRLDLLYRLAGIVIEMPPLRDRPEDIPALAEHFLDEARLEYGQEKHLSAGVIDELVRRDFPGNVRELRHTVRRAYATCDGDAIHPQHLRDPFGVPFADAPQHAPASSDGEPEFTLPSERQRFLLRPAICRCLVCALAEAKGNLSETARLLGIPRSTLQHHLMKYRINADAFRRGGASASTAQAVAQPREATALSSVPL